MSDWERRVVGVVVRTAGARILRAHGVEYHGGCCLDIYFGEWWSVGVMKV